MSWARKMGLSTVSRYSPGTLYRDDAYRHHFDGYAIPEGFEVKFAMTLGYPDESPAPRPRDVRKIVYYD